jgi:hypothetical protein
MSSRRQASTEARPISEKTSGNSIIVCKNLSRGDYIQVRPFYNGQLIVVRVVVNENGTVIVYVKAADPKDQRAFTELTNGYFEAAKHAVTLLRKAAAMTPEAQADGEDDANMEGAPAVEVAPLRDAAVPEHAKKTAAAAEETTPEAQADGEDDANTEGAPAVEVAPLRDAAVPEHAKKTAAAAEETTLEAQADGEDDANTEGAPAVEVAPLRDAAVPEHAKKTAAAAEETTPETLADGEDDANTEGAPAVEMTPQVAPESASLEGGKVNLAMRSSCIDAVREENAKLDPSSALHFGYDSNIFNTYHKDGCTLNLPRALADCNDELFDDAVISKLKSDAGSVVLMTQSLYPLPGSQCRFLYPTDDYRPYVWLNFNLSQLPCLLMVKFFIAYCFLEAAAVGFKGYKNPKSRLCNGFWLENTFRYLLDKTLVVIVAILLPTDFRRKKSTPFSREPPCPRG